MKTLDKITLEDAIAIAKTYFLNLTYENYKLDYKFEVALFKHSIKPTNYPTIIFHKSGTIDGIITPDAYAKAIELGYSIPAFENLLMPTKEKLSMMVWDGFLIAEYQDNWNDADTTKLIVNKILKNEPIKIAKSYPK